MDLLQVAKTAPRAIVGRPLPDAIVSLRPKVTSTEAFDLLRTGFSGLLRRVTRGPLCSIAPVYVPFRVYRVSITPRRPSVTFFAIDAVNGLLDLYWFPELPTPAEVVTINTRNHPSARLDESLSRELVRDKVRRLLFQTCAHKLDRLAIHVQGDPLDIHMPYWVGFFGSRSRAYVRVIDAVRRRPEGAKVSELIESWLAGWIETSPSQRLC